VKPKPVTPRPTTHPLPQHRATPRSEKSLNRRLDADAAQSA